MQLLVLYFLYEEKLFFISFFCQQIVKINKYKDYFIIYSRLQCKDLENRISSFEFQNRVSELFLYASYNLINLM